MDPFVRRLIERLHDPSRPLSRNRHFHTFETPEGRRALRVSRRLKSLQRDILAARNRGPGNARVLKLEPAPDQTEEEHRVEIHLAHVRGSRVTVLPRAEFELLTALPGVSDALASEEH